MLEAIETYNNETKNDEDKYVVGSMDATALYPSLRADKSVEIVKEEIINSNITFENIDMHELGMYLRQNLPNDYIVENGYDKWLPVKVNPKRERKGAKRKEKDHDPYKFVDDIHFIFMNDNVDDDVPDNDPEIMVQKQNLHDDPSQGGEHKYEEKEGLCQEGHTKNPDVNVKERLHEEINAVQLSKEKEKKKKMRNYMMKK